MKMHVFILLLIAIYSERVFGREINLMGITPTSIELPLQSWKSLRDARVVKQDLDYSCGAASLATLLNEFYGQNFTEKHLLEAMDKGELRASFHDMKMALLKFGFHSVAITTSYEELAKIKIPVIVYLKHRKSEHFSVLRGIDSKTVLLADPSLGNRTYSREQFLSMWRTRSDVDRPELEGKFLAVRWQDGRTVENNGFFTKTPRRQSAPALQHLQTRHYP